MIHNLIPSESVASVYDSRLLYIPNDKTLLVALNVTIEQLHINPGILLVFNGVMTFRMANDIPMVSFSEDESKLLCYGVLFEITTKGDGKLSEYKSFLVNAYPNKRLFINAKSYTILSNCFNVR